MRKKTRAQIELMTDEDLGSVAGLLAKIGGPNVAWGAKQTLDVWLTETRLEADRLAARRLLTATWVLALATIGLVLATIGLIVVSVNG